MLYTKNLIVFDAIPHILTTLTDIVHPEYSAGTYFSGMLHQHWD